MLDLDHLKEINDTYGPPVGDTVLETTGNLIDRNTRKSDVCGRYGGEEFRIALVGTGIDKAEAIAQWLRQALARRTFHSIGNDFQVTCNIGLVEFEDEEEDETASSYEKTNGRGITEGPRNITVPIRRSHLRFGVPDPNKR